jgi:hypothetical protein
MPLVKATREEHMPSQIAALDKHLRDLRHRLARPRLQETDAVLSQRAVIVS